MTVPAPKGIGEIREFLKVHVDPEAGPNTIIRTPWGNMGLSYQKPDGSGKPQPLRSISHPECTMVVEDWFPGETVTWFLPHPEFHYILKGTAEVTYTLAPWHDEEKSMTIGPGDAYLVPFASHVTWKISPEGPVRKIVVVMPLQTMYREVPPKNMAEL